MSRGPRDLVVHRNLALLEDLLDKQGRIVQLEEQEFARLETELRTAAEYAEDSASDHAKPWSEPDSGNVDAAELIERSEKSASKKERQKRRSPRLAKGRSERRSTASGHIRKPKARTPSEDSTDTFSSSDACPRKKQKEGTAPGSQERELSPLRPGSIAACSVPRVGRAFPISVSDNRSSSSDNTDRIDTKFKRCRCLSGCLPV